MPLPPSAPVNPAPNDADPVAKEMAVAADAAAKAGAPSADVRLIAKRAAINHLLSFD